MDKEAQQKLMKETFLNGSEHFITNLSIDCVIFGFDNNQLKVLLLKWSKIDKWSLPGGFILKKEHIDQSAKRILQERTGLTDIYLRQFSTFGAPKRSHHSTNSNTFEGLDLNIPEDSWIMDRFISIGYYALVNFSEVTLKEDFLSEKIAWWDIEEVPLLIMDHKEIMKSALKALRLQLNSEPVGLNLLPEKFTLPELQKIYETILDKEIDRRNFRKKMLSLHILEKLNERKTGGAHRAANLYRFNEERYAEVLKEGLKPGY